MVARMEQVERRTLEALEEAASLTAKTLNELLAKAVEVLPETSSPEVRKVLGRIEFRSRVVPASVRGQIEVVVEPVAEGIPENSVRNALALLEYGSAAQSVPVLRLFSRTMKQMREEQAAVVKAHLLSATKVLSDR